MSHCDGYAATTHGAVGVTLQHAPSAHTAQAHASCESLVFLPD